MKTALIESKKLLEYIIEFIDEPQNNNTLNSIEHYIKALNIGCECDNYNGFDCGCNRRAFLCNEALKQLNKKIKEDVDNNKSNYDYDNKVKIFLTSTK